MVLEEVLFKIENLPRKQRQLKNTMPKFQQEEAHTWGRISEVKKIPKRSIKNLNNHPSLKNRDFWARLARKMRIRQQNELKNRKKRWCNTMPVFSKSKKGLYNTKSYMLSLQIKMLIVLESHNYYKHHYYHKIRMICLGPLRMTVNLEQKVNMLRSNKFSELWTRKVSFWLTIKVWILLHHQEKLNVQGLRLLELNQHQINRDCLQITMIDQPHQARKPKLIMWWMFILC